jgi:outer membrane usher protein FimD/PapC
MLTSHGADTDSRLVIDGFRARMSVFNRSSLLLLFFCATLLISFHPLPAAAEQLIAKVILNQEDKGDFFVIQGKNGDFLVKPEDLKKMGFKAPSGSVSMLEGEAYISIRDIEGIECSFNEETLALSITAKPTLLGKEVIDFVNQQTEKVYYPNDSSIFFNYGANYQAENGFSFASFNLTNQLGIRKDDVLFLTDSVFTKDQTRDRFIRLQSSLVHDDRKTLRRLNLGDFFASSGILGGSINMGGISFAKVYRIDPYFINYPTLDITGQVALPSEAKIYLNGMLMKSETFSPGEFELRNITPYGAAGIVDIVLKDAFGREQRLNYPFYFSDALLLKKGLHEYSYNLGFTREQFGAESNRYSKPAFSAFHRYGITDAVTFGIRAEATNNLYNMGPQLTFIAGNAGIFNLSLAGSMGKDSNTGSAGIANYTYQGLKAGFRVSLAGYTRKYAVVSSGSTTDKIKYSGSIGANYTDRLLGTLSCDYTTLRKFEGQNRDAATISYNRTITNNSSITATYRRVKENGHSNEFLISLNYTPKPNHFITAGYESTSNSRSATVSVQKNIPIGEGIGYQATIKRSESGSHVTYTANPSVQYNGRYGILRGDYSNQISEGAMNGQYNLSVSGALVYVGKTFGATRPVYDSFGLVNTGGIEGVKVLLNSQEVGATDSSGKLFVPSLGSYTQNQLGIQDKDIPMDYYISSVKRFVSPPLRSGSCIPFVIKKMQPISGRLAMRINGELKPVEFQEVYLAVKGREIAFPTGSGGEFDIDLSQSDVFKKVLELEESGCASIADTMSGFLSPGTYRASVMHEGKKRSFNLTIPDSKDPIIDLGQLVIEAP